MNRKIYKLKDQYNVIEHEAKKKMEAEFLKKYDGKDINRHSFYIIIHYVIPVFTGKKKYFAVVGCSMETVTTPEGSFKVLKDANGYTNHRYAAIVKVFVKSAYTYTITDISEPEEINFEEFNKTIL